MNAPKFRFKDNDGQEYPDWIEGKLGEIGSVLMCKRILKEQTQPVGDVPFYKIGTFGKQPDAYISNEVYESFKQKYSFPKKGDILISAAGTIGRTVVYDGLPAYFQDSNIVWIDNNGEKVKNAFLYYLYAKTTWNTENTTIARLYNDNLKSIFIKFPSIPEQTKIANFLTAVDEKITQLTQKHDLLTQYKKGVMQQIFSQELRFKDDDGRDFPEWRTLEFGEIFSFKTTNSYSRECLNYVSGTVKNIHYGDIHTKFKSRFNISHERVPFVNENIALTKLKPDCFCVEGDLVIADASEDYKDIGKCIEIVNLGNQPVVAGLHTFLARPRLDVLSRGFMSHAMRSEAVRLQIMTVAQGTKVLSISTGRLSKVGIPLPKKEEQIKIANFLTAIDDKVTQTQAELDAVKQYKQALLQQMFV